MSITSPLNKKGGETNFKFDPGLEISEGGQGGKIFGERMSEIISESLN